MYTSQPSQIPLSHHPDLAPSNPGRASPTMDHHLRAYKALFGIPWFLRGTLVSVIHGLYQGVSPDMPFDLQSTPVTSPIAEAPDAPVLHFNFDEGHAGRFSVPETEGGSLSVDYVLSRPHPGAFVMANLAFYDPFDTPAAFSPETEIVIFSPGLNTFHAPSPSHQHRTSVERVIHYVSVLGSHPMAQIHTGTSSDQPTIVTNASRAPLLRFLLNFLPGPARPEQNDQNQLLWSPQTIDAMQTTLSYINYWDTPLKSAFVKLLETSKLPDAPPFVLMVYSRASVECDAALRKHVEESRKTESKLQIERRLRERVTIVTVGSASSTFVDGPAYLHLAAWTDSLATSLGVTAKHNAHRAGKDAVFLNCNTPYNDKAFDNHNFSSSTSQFLSLVLHKNNARGYRDLWEKARAGEMKIHDNVDELCRAVITVTNGTDYLWNPEDAWDGVDKSILPDLETAKVLLREQMGDEYIDRLLINFDGTW